MESSKDNDNDSAEDKVIDWGLVFSLLKNRGFSHEEILNLSYPQFNAYMNNINNPLAYSVTIPYMGGGEEKKEEKIDSKQEIINIIAEMNRQFV